MILDNETFARVREVAQRNGYPTAFVQYSGAEDVTIRGEKTQVVWFTCRDRAGFARRGARLAFSEDFRLMFWRPLCYVASVGEKRFRVACSRTGRTLSRV